MIDDLLLRPELVTPARNVSSLGPRPWRGAPAADLHDGLACKDNIGPLLSVLVPVYNEERTLAQVLHRIRASPYDKEVIVVDDGSRDQTPQVLEEWEKVPGFRILRHPHNLGKGAAVRTALQHVRGEITLIQDADLEYDPAEWPRLVEVIRRGESDVVYGSRYLRPGPLPWTSFRFGVVFLNGVVRLLYGRGLTDEATCYKVFRTRVLRGLRLESRRFEFCAEVTAKLCRLRCPILEVPISYRPRTVSQGKKIRWRDGWRTLWTLLKWRLCPFPYRTELPE